MNKNRLERLHLAQPDDPNVAAPWVGGVASGVAERLSVPVSAVRAGFVGLSAVFGLGFMLYMWLWLSLSAAETETATEIGEGATQWTPLAPKLKEMPQNALTEATPQPLPRNRGEDRRRRMLVGQLVLGGLGFLSVALLFAIAASVLNIPWSAVVGFLLTAGGILLSWLQAPKFAEGRNGEASAYVAASIAVAIGGLVLLMGALGIVPKLVTGMTIAGLVLAVLAVALVPLIMKVTDDLAGSREREIREAERADIAAHLHDSVLQTLTLVRANAEDAAATRSLALRQERELRAWLYTGRKVEETSVAEGLRNQIAGIEGTYGVAVEVVTVGDRQPTEREWAGLAAATEAVTNAIKHGDPPISVYQEIQDGSLDIYVKDAGPGFDPKRIPPDRHGYQGSIVDRVERVGGTVTLRQPNKSGQSVGGAGTEIHIHIPTRQVKAVG